MSAGAWIGLAVVLQCGGLAALRASGGLRRPVLAVCAYAGLVGSIVPVGRAVEDGMALAVAYSLWTGAGIAFAAVGGVALFGDRLSRPQVVGLALLLVGLVAVEAG